MTCPAIRGPGGIATYARNILDALAPESVVVLSHGRSREVADLPRNARFLGSPETRSGFSARLAYDYLTRPPTVFLFAHVGLTAPLALLPRRRDHRVVLIGHGLEIWPKLTARRGAGLSHVDSAVFTTHYNLALFQARNGNRLPPKATLEVIPLSAAREQEGSTPSPVPNGARKRVVCVTRLVSEEPLKGLPALIGAARHLPRDWEIVIVGDGESRGDLQRLATKLAVSHRVQFTGWLSDADRTRALTEAQVFCLPSAQEGFGIVFLEAMVAGRPCVGAAAGAVPEVVRSEVGELFPYDDEAAMARAILRAHERLHSGDLTPTSIRAFYDSTYSWSRFRKAWNGYVAGLRT